MGIMGTLVLTTLFTGCGPSRKTPEGTVQLLLRAVAKNDMRNVYSLLGPNSRNTLQRHAERAMQLTNEEAEPEEFLAAQLQAPVHKVAQIELVEEDDAKARVRLADASGEQTEEIDLVRGKDGWHVELDLPLAQENAPE